MMTHILYWLKNISASFPLPKLWYNNRRIKMEGFILARSNYLMADLIALSQDLQVAKTKPTVDQPQDTLLEAFVTFSQGVQNEVQEITYPAPLETITREKNTPRPIRATVISK